MLFLLVAVQLETGFGGSRVNSLFTNWLYDGVGEVAAVTCMIRGLRHSEDRAAWVLIGAAVASWTAGDVYYTFALQNDVHQPFPSLADAGYLGFYLPAFVGLGRLVRSRVVHFAGSVWLDGLIAGLSVCAVAGEVVLDQVWRTSTGGLAAVATNLAYPAGDMLLLAVVLAAFAFSGWSLDRTWLLVGGALGFFAIADSVYLVQIADGSYHYGSLLDLGWPAAFVLIAAASCAPRGRARTARLEGWVLLAVPVLMSVICLTIVVWDHFQRVNAIALVAAVLGLAAVIARLALTFGEHLRLLETTRAESLTDALTGLSNRRALLRRLDELSSQPAVPHLLLLFDLDGFKAYNDSFGHSVGDALLRRLGQRLRQSVGGRGSAYRLGGDEFCILVAGDSVDLEWVRAAATASLRESGEGFTITCSSGHALIPLETESANQALQLADRRMYAEKANVSGRQNSRHVLLQALAERDGNLGHHTSAVADYASMLALEAGLDGAEAKLVRAAAELHDVGKLALPETLLSKPEPLDETEWKLVRKHTMIGERIIAAGEGLAEVAKIVRSTHERWDGTGYPDGLVGEQIPLEARLIAICDAYDAMTANRPYQQSRTPEDACGELYRSAGSQFDPDLARLFIDRVLPALAARLPRSA
ncbi:MAG: HD domain-containing phosphohydrolase [Gaiellaceae bacterium]